MIGILYICTGKYHMFWKEFYLSAERFFLPSYKKKYFVFTDAEEIYGEANPQVNKIYQNSLGWPHNTLMRYEIFSKTRKHLEECDYLFFINANTKFVAVINDDILPGEIHDGLMAVIHPYFWDKNAKEFSYERNPRSTAFIPFGEGQHYFMGAFNGGTSTAFLALTETLKNNIETDLQKGIIAEWWDESHLNHYMLNRNPLALTPAYLYPENYDLPFEPKLVILDKSKYGGHSFLRGAQ